MPRFSYPHITAEEARHRLGPFQDLLHETVDGAWAAWEALLPSIPFEVYGRTRSTFLQNAMAERAKALFADVPGVTHHTSKQLFLLLIHGRAILRFQKHDEEGVPATNGTQQELEFTQQRLFSGDLPHLSVGYDLKDDRTGIFQVTVSLLDDANEPVWCYAVHKPDAGVVLPLAPTGVPSQQPRTEVRPVATARRRRKRRDE